MSLGGISMTPEATNVTVRTYEGATTMNDITPAQILDEWVTDLRSGNYTQDTGHLCIIDPTGVGNRAQRRYCCLGVLCEVGVRHGLLTRIDGSDVASYTWADGGTDQRDDLLPLEYATWLGIDQDPGLVVVDEGEKATTLNDDAGLTFGEIAVAAERLVSRVKSGVPA